MFKKIAIISLIILSNIPTLYSLESEIVAKAIVGEAAGEGYKGMLAVACAIRNRGNVKGVYGIRNYRASYNSMIKYCNTTFNKSSKEYSNCLVQSEIKFDKLFEEAKKAWEESTKKDIVKGADHWENIDDFGIPSWAKEMKKTVKIGKQTFYKKTT